jgi:hypothetical protein
MVLQIPTRTSRDVNQAAIERFYRNDKKNFGLKPHKSTRGLESISPTS